MTDRYITVEIEQMRAAVSTLASKKSAKQMAPIAAVAGNYAE